MAGFGDGPERSYDRLKNGSFSPQNGPLRSFLCLFWADFLLWADFCGVVVCARVGGGGGACLLRRPEANRDTGRFGRQ